jgi:nucleotide-binding universal stress UspA family protein
MATALARRKMDGMYHHVLVGVDGGPGGRDAIALARRLAAPDARISLVNVWSSARGVMAAATGTEHPSITADRLLSRTRLDADLHCACVAHGAASTGAGLHHLVEATGADLLVVGSAGPDREAGRTTLSEEIRGALHGASCALAVAAFGYADTVWPVGRIGVAYTATPVGEAAVRCARALAADLEATVHGLTVVPMLPSAWMGGPIASITVLEDITGTSLRRARRELEGLGMVPHTVSGPPATEIVRFSEHADLLVLGSRNYGPVRRLLFGSTSSQVLGGKPYCPVLIVPLPNGAPSPPVPLTGAREPVISN